MKSQIASLTSFHSTDYSDADQRKHQSSASLAFVRGIHRWPVNYYYIISGNTTCYVVLFPVNCLSFPDRLRKRGPLSCRAMSESCTGIPYCCGTSQCYYANGYRPFQVRAALWWRHNEHDGVSNHRRLDCFDKRLFKRWSKKAWKLRVTSLCEGNSPVTGEFPAQSANNAENASSWWRHYANKESQRPFRIKSITSCVIMGTFVV